MPCEILILHDSPLIKKTIQQIILTEFNEVRGEASDSLQDCQQKLDNRLYHMILCPQQTAGWTTFDLRELLKRSKLNQRTPIVVITAAGDLSNQADLAEQGFSYVLPITGLAKELAEIVNRLYKPREYRASPRYFIPQTIVTIHCQERDESADIINISRYGIHCEIAFADKPHNLLTPSTISIQFPGEYSNVKISNIATNLLRMQVRLWNQDKSPQYLNVVWKFIEMSEADGGILDKILEKAGREKAELEKKMEQEWEVTPI